jgi:hypothetical protein
MSCTTARAGPQLCQQVHAIGKPSWLVHRDSCCEFLFITGGENITTLETFFITSKVNVQVPRNSYDRITLSAPL